VRYQAALRPDTGLTNMRNLTLPMR
jgi:hypothetical protein